ncbi:hypothetical protein IHE44_0013554 [Lamprotornis superbus]|uniref:Uncharacterized protein n=1 Tax=Lamprotornis superbus TaxID=245042 RepID=A0A835NGZ3_9PASS|nr:hypothetical protein IHE44_0013554 [Lamprotornis superbus]
MLLTHGVNLPINLPTLETSPDSHVVMSGEQHKARDPSHGLYHGGQDAGEGDVPSNAELGDLVQPPLTEVVLQQYLMLTSGRCYSGMESKLQPPCSTQQCPMEAPVPVWVGLHSPSDGDEQPRDNSCLQGQLKGDFLGDNRDLVSAKNHVKSPMPPLGTASPGPSRGQAKSATEDTETLMMTEPLPLEGLVLPEEELVLPVEQKAQIQDGWMVVLGQETAPLLLAVQGMLQVLLDMLLVLLVLQDKLQVLQDMLLVLQGRLQVLQGMLQVLQDRLQVLQGRLQVLQGRLQVLQDTLGMHQELLVGSPRRASPGLGWHKGLGCCCWPRHQITGDRGEDKGQVGEIPPGITLSSPKSIFGSLQHGQGQELNSQLFQKT